MKMTLTSCMSGNIRKGDRRFRFSSPFSFRTVISITCIFIQSNYPCDKTNLIKINLKKNRLPQKIGRL